MVGGEQDLKYKSEWVREWKNEWENTKQEKETESETKGVGDMRQDDERDYLNW